ncbi:MAG: P1 family peptidase [Oscillospiraceae bacterium]|jgi:D-aminopeptidase|nr:P1 family peptidase [Oscillospiraceae bacterium]
MGLTASFPFPLIGGLHARFRRGPLNLITDVPGVRVAHVDIRGKLDEPRRAVRTGVTVIMPGSGHPFRDKFTAGAHVINGFGKSVGLMQIAELGTLETPIVLTNTLSVGAGFIGAARYMLDITPEIGETTGTVNPIVLECNDSPISDLRAMAVAPEDVTRAIKLAQSAGDAFAEGAVGAGSGMTCYGLKGGIGSASRIVEAGGTGYTLGCLAMTNFGSLCDLTLAGCAVGAEINAALENDRTVVIHPFGDAEPRDECGDSDDSGYSSDSDGKTQDRGSVIIVAATDAPLSDRQLTRLAKRAQSGIARTGGYTGNGSGEIAVAFSTANRVPHDPPAEPRVIQTSPESIMDTFFAAMVSAVEESILSSMEHAGTTPARRGGVIMGLNDALSKVSPLCAAAEGANPAPRRKWRLTLSHDGSEGYSLSS